MSCYNPNVMTVGSDRESGSLIYHFDGPYARHLFDPRTQTPDLLADHGRYQMLVPCGCCTGCLFDRASEWANRMMAELKSNDYRAIFATLTYRDADLPLTADGPSLSKVDLQLFFKRLRARFAGQKIRYFVCGEYGPRTHRPHYHAVIFGLDLSDFTDILPDRSRSGKPAYRSDLFASIWSHGICQLSPVSWQTCAYTARYVTKKLKSNAKFYASDARQREFTLSSRRPGLGMDECARVLNAGHSHIICGQPGEIAPIPIPRSVLKRFKATACKNPFGLNLSHLADVCSQRVTDGLARTNMLLSETDLTYKDYLRVQYDIFRRRISPITAQERLEDVPH